MVSEYQIEKVMLGIGIIMYLLWFWEVFIYFTAKLQCYNVKDRTGDKCQCQDKSKEINDINKNNQLNLINMMDTPVIELLFKQNKKQPTRQIRQKPSLLQKLIIITLSLIIATLICLMFFSLLQQENLHNIIANSYIKNVTNCHYSEVKQVNILNIFQSRQQENIIYQNHLSCRIDLLNIIANLTFLVKIFYFINKKQQNYNTYEIKKISIILNFVLNAIMIVVNPSFVSIIVLQLLTNIFNNKINLSKQNKQLNKTSLINSILKNTTLLIIFSLFICHQLHKPSSIFHQIYTKMIFPQQFSPQSNLMWIFYAHMFNRYRKMYQLIMFILPIFFAIPLSLLKINQQTKIISQYFTIIFTSYYCTNLQIYTFWLLVFLSLKNFNAFQDPLLRKINKSLGLVAFVGSSFFFFANKKILSLYLSSWMVNIGYIFAFGCVSWALIAIWISELIKIQLQQIANVPYESKQTGKVTKIIQKIKNKLWTKTS